ncbi:hypothetical protein U9K52_08530 [Chryseobacterium sp. MHB01]|uniref:hypothetical protein n=1 Tax=Chryseobacterium sp. MHB01 TaxID=3109433 RepID=UPI002AFE36A6|nr:hypothetical protein [Chryseobacterium sp. MHB01]MEA1848954.1 hypothetical protein [Chryseobacterium sp. MHB01]
MKKQIVLKEGLLRDKKDLQEFILKTGNRETVEVEILKARTAEMPVKFTNTIENRYKDFSLLQIEERFKKFSTEEFSTEKALITRNVDDLESGIVKRGVIGNTYYWYDSHQDVHVGNTFKKSISDTNGDFSKTFFIADHDKTFNAIAGYLELVKEKDVYWYDLGVNKEGKTRVLWANAVYRQKDHPKLYDLVLENKVDQYSVGMIYQKYQIAMKSDSPDFADYNATWDKYIRKLGNQDEAEEDGLFFAISEAKLDHLSPVLKASNRITMTVPNEKSEPGEPTHKHKNEDEPRESTPQTEKKFNVFVKI